MLKEKIKKLFYHCYKNFNSKLFEKALIQNKTKAEVTPVYKKENMNNKQNYRPVTTLSNLSKIFGKLIYSQINTYMSDEFLRYLTGFRKNHNTQHAMLNMTENWKSNLNKGIKQELYLWFCPGLLTHWTTPY